MCGEVLWSGCRLGHACRPLGRGTPPPSQPPFTKQKRIINGEGRSVAMTTNMFPQQFGIELRNVRETQCVCDRRMTWTC